MNRSIILAACLMQTPLWAQISPLPPPNPLPDFAIDFGAAPPPSYIGGVTYLVVSDFPYLNFNLGYFTVPATSAWLAKRQADNSLTPMFQMYPQTANVVGAGLVYSYTPGFPINNSAIRVSDFLAGLWYVQFHFGSATYTAQIVPIPDTQPPQIVVAVTPNVLWPPNHRMVPISVVVNALDNQDPSPVARITQVTSNEPGN